MAITKQSLCKLLTACYVMLLSACVAGPDFKQPPPPEVAAYIQQTVAGETATQPVAAETQRLMESETVPQHWWQAFGSNKLNTLITDAFASNPSLTAARASLRQAQALYAGKSGSTRYPQISANLGAQRQRYNPAAQGQTGQAQEFALFNASVDMRYSFDLSGASQRALEALAAQTHYQQYQLTAARLTLAANITVTAITQARRVKELASLETILRYQTAQLALAEERVRLGQAQQSEVLALQTRVEQTRATLPAVRNQLQQTQHLLATLTGQAPAAAGHTLFVLDDFSLPATLPLVVPSQLVRSRPDILASEALLRVANAEYGVAIANMYPQLTLNAAMGSQALSSSGLFASGSGVWSLVGQLTQPLFNPGLPAEKRAALAAFDAAAAHYRSVVLDSLRDVADVLRNLENDSVRLVALTAAENAARSSLAATQQQYDLGVISYNDLIIAQEQFQKLKLDLIDGQARRLINSVALYQAMGVA